MPFQGVTMPGPVLGLDLTSPIDNMDPSHALELINVFPGNGLSSVRQGYFKFAKPSSNAIRFMTQLAKTDGTKLLVAATNTELYSVSTAGVVTNITKASPHTSGEFTSVIFNNKIYLCNNAGTATDQAQYWDGSAAQAADLAFTGVSLQNLCSVSSYRERLYFVERNSMNMWYGALNATGVAASALTSFDTSRTFKHGGYLIHAGSYTNQTAISSQNLFFACTSEGELAFWQGTDPGNTTGSEPWTLVARYKIGKPLGFRCFVRVGADIWVITQQGIVPISALFQADPEMALKAVSDKLNPLIASSAKAIPFSYLWGGFTWSIGRRVYITAPISAGTSWFFVYSMDSKGWTIFQLDKTTDSLSSCVFNDLPYYGGSDGTIWKGETGYTDRAETGVAGNAIYFNIRTPFSFYGTRGNYKVFRDIRPIVQTQPGYAFNLGLDLDFKKNAIIPAVTSTTGDPTDWGDPWGSPWASSTEYVFDRYATRGQGYCASIRFSGALNNVSLNIFSFEVRYEVGGQV